MHTAVIPIVKALEKYIPQPYADEIRGMAAYYQSDITDIILLNFAYEVSAYVLHTHVACNIVNSVLVYTVFWTIIFCKMKV